MSKPPVFIVFIFQYLHTYEQIHSFLSNSVKYLISLIILPGWKRDTMFLSCVVCILLNLPTGNRVCVNAYVVAEIPLYQKLYYYFTIMYLDLQSAFEMCNTNSLNYC